MVRATTAMQNDRFKVYLRSFVYFRVSNTTQLSISFWFGQTTSIAYYHFLISVTWSWAFYSYLLLASFPFFCFLIKFHGLFISYIWGIQGLANHIFREIEYREYESATVLLWYAQHTMLFTPGCTRHPITCVLNLLWYKINIE